MNTPKSNPFVGPRPIRGDEALHGRDKEVRELYYRLQAHRVVVLHSPSGAGKSSLIHAGLIPRLKEGEYDVWNPIRVNLDPRGIPDIAPGTNRYLLSAMMSLEEELPPERRRGAAELARLDFGTYLSTRPRRRSRADCALVLLFDQFEEILTVAPWAEAEKRAFFREVGEALDARDRCGLFVVREDYLAALAPYRDLLPTQLAHTFRLDLLSRQAAVEVAEKLAGSGVPPRAFPGAVRLLRDLSAIQTQQPDGTFVVEHGPYVEPVYLQVVCRRMWDALPAEVTTIEDKDVAAYADISRVLAGYYSQEVKKIARGDVATERALRDWVGNRLIAGGIRSQVRQEPGQSAGLDNGLVSQLLGCYLVRAEQRAGGTWYELSHDRLLAPVLTDNQAWEQANLQPMQVQARSWENARRTDTLLLSAEALPGALAWAARSPGLLTDGEKEFLERSRKQREREAGQRRRRQVFTAALAMVALVATGLGVVAMHARGAAQRAHAVAAERFISGLEERGRFAWLNGHATHAMLYAGRAYQEGSRSTSTLSILGLAASVTIDAPVAKLTGHTDIVYSVATFTAADTGSAPLSSLLVSASADQTARLWDVTNPRSPRFLSSLGGPDGHGAKVRAASFRADGKQVVTAGDDSSARLWDVADPLHPVFLGALRGHEKPIRSAAFSPDGASVVTASDDGTARLWDVSAPASPKPSGVLAGHEGAVISAAFSPDGKRVVTASLDGTARLWSVERRATEATLAGHRSAVLFAAFSPDGTQVVTGSGDNTARLWDAATGASMHYLGGHGDQVVSAGWSGDGRVVTGSYDGAARVWNTATGERLVTLVGHDGPVLSATFLADDRTIATAGRDATVRLYRADGPQLANVLLPGKVGINHVEFSPDGTLVLFAVGRAAVLLDVRDPLGPTLAATLPHQEKNVESASFSVDGRRVITTCSDGTAELWDVTDRARPRRTAAWKAHEAKLRWGKFAPAGAPLLVTAGDDRKARLWKVAGEGAPQALAALEGHDDVVTSAAFSPDGRRLVTASLDESAILWDLADPGAPARVFRWTGIHRGATAADFSPDGARVIIGGQDTLVRLFDAGHPENRPLELAGQGQSVTDGRFSRDGLRFVTTGTGASVRLWDAATGVVLGALMGHGDDVLSAAFSPDGNYVVTGGLDATVRLWDVRLEKRTFEELAERMRCSVPLRWEGERLQPARLPDCAATASPSAAAGRSAPDGGQ